MKTILSENYSKQLKLLLEVIPYVFAENCFCLKGGTAINLFMRDMPRASVDIDLVYLPIKPREEALNEIESALLNIKKSILSTLPNSEIFEKRTAKDNRLIKLFVQKDNTQIIIEPNTVLRGHLYAIEKRNTSSRVEELLQMAATEIPILNTAELYAGKICAALDRQHPRDLFDVKYLYENEGLTDELRQAFVVYLACSSRPMHELLRPNLLDISQLFQNEFQGMSASLVSYDDLILTRKKLIADLSAKLTEEEKIFLISIKEGNPRFELLPIKNLELFSALRWKVLNIQRIDSKKRQELVGKLKDVLGVR